MATYNHKVEIVNGDSIDTYHPETNAGQVYDFNNEKWLSEIIGVLSNLTTAQKNTLVESINSVKSQTDSHMMDVTKKHIEIVDEIPTNLQGTGVFFKKQDATPDTPKVVYGGRFEWRYNDTTGSLDLTVLEKTGVTPTVPDLPSYGDKFQWRYNERTDSLDLVVLS